MEGKKTTWTGLELHWQIKKSDLQGSDWLDNGGGRRALILRLSMISRLNNCGSGSSFTRKWSRLEHQICWKKSVHGVAWGRFQEWHSEGWPMVVDWLCWSNHFSDPTLGGKWLCLDNGWELLTLFDQRNRKKWFFTNLGRGDFSQTGFGWTHTEKTRIFLTINVNSTSTI